MNNEFYGTCSVYRWNRIERNQGNNYRLQSGYDGVVGLMMWDLGPGAESAVYDPLASWPLRRERRKRMVGFCRGHRPLIRPPYRGPSRLTDRDTGLETPTLNDQKTQR